MAMIRPLIVDDSVVVRQVLTRLLSDSPEIEVVGSAANGQIGLRKLEALSPNVVILDIHMPIMNGLEMLEQLRVERPDIPVLLFCSLDECHEVAAEAMRLGASDFLAKPRGMDRDLSGPDGLLEKLRNKLRALIGMGTLPSAALSSAAAATAPQPQPPPPRPRPGRTVRPQLVPSIITIGVSTGGPKALEQVIPQLPADLPVPVVIVQHMPPMFTKLLAERLDARSALSVGEGYEGAPVEPGRVWIAPGGYHMEVTGGRGDTRLHLHEGPLENSCRPAVDVLFRSVVDLYGGNTLGVILTGMGQDGLRGSEVIYEAGGRIIAQDEATSTVWGMPGAVTRAGLADRILPLDRVWTEIVTLVRGRPKQPPAVTQPRTGELGC
ncbi:MAG: chemotaxis response regulator protein-glutamate methylesterase [Myxococcales bacterium]|nr:chemotaxis response regulator protein-glutamate methylesterase [Myxococcales bacterium]